MRLCVFTIIVILIHSSAWAEPPDTAWTWTFNGSSNSWASSIVPHPSGGYFVCGTVVRDSATNEHGWNEADIRVLHLDEQGDTLWSRSYGEPGWYVSSAELIGTPDGGFALAGNREAYQADNETYLLKADSDGEPQWDSAYSSVRDFNWAVGLDRTVNGDYVLACNYLGGGWDFGVSRLYGGWGEELEDIGNQLLDITYPWALNEAVGSVAATDDGGFVVCGWSNSESIVHEDLFLMKVSTFGITEWTRFYDQGDAEEPGRVRQTADGGFIVVGEAVRGPGGLERGLYMLKTDRYGNKEWSDSFGGSTGRDVIELSDGGFLATGRNGYTTRVSAEGEMVWSAYYGDEQTTSVSVAESPLGGYVLAGRRTTPLGGESVLSLYVVKIVGDDIPTSVEDNGNEILPSGPYLSQNNPNPFNPATEISFTLPRTSDVTLDIYNILGQKVETLVCKTLPPGEHTVSWDARSKSSGTYFYRLEAGGFVDNRKMVLVK